MPTYLISRLGDPMFAVGIGLSAALTRMRREQKEKYPEQAKEIGYGTVLGLGMSRLQRWWAGDFTGL